jgi:excisionase family DNA binding protein
MLGTKLRPANLDIVRPRVPHGRLAIAPKAEDRAGIERTQMRRLRIGEVCALVGISRAMVYKCMAQETLPFPKPVKIGAASRWAFEDVNAWVVALRGAREQSA